jgi:hypothetical protein
VLSGKHILIREGNSPELRALKAKQHYFFAIESFDENGVSRLSEVVRVE